MLGIKELKKSFFYICQNKGILRLLDPESQFLIQFQEQKMQIKQKLYHRLPLYVNNESMGENFIFLKQSLYNKMNWNTYNPFMIYPYTFYNYVWSAPNPKPDLPTVDQVEPTPNITPIMNNTPPIPISTLQHPEVPIPNQPLLVVNKKEELEQCLLKKRQLRKQKLLKKREREDNFEQKKQKKDRNIPSNIFKYFLAYIAKNEKLLELIKKIFSGQLALEPSSFKVKVKEFFKNKNGYIRLVTIRQLCQEDYLDKNESLLFRVMLRKFLILELPLQIIQMSKYKKRQRRQFIKIARNMYSQIMGKQYSQ